MGTNTHHEQLGAAIGKEAQARTIIPPTVGRIVWYWPSKHDESVDIGFYDDTPLRADICYVHEDGTVNLSINDCTGKSFTRCEITVFPGDVAGCYLPRPFATWPPQERPAKKPEERDTSLQELQAIDLDTRREQLRALRLQNDHAELVNEANRQQIEATKLAIGVLRKNSQEQAKKTEPNG